MSLSKLVAGRLGLTSHSVRRITSYEGPSYDTVRDIRGTKLSPAMLTYYREPLLIHSGKMQYLYDHKGQEYLDMFGGIVTVRTFYYDRLIYICHVPGLSGPLPSPGKRGPDQASQHSVAHHQHLPPPKGPRVRRQAGGDPPRPSVCRLLRQQRQ